MQTRQWCVAAVLACLAMPAAAQTVPAILSERDALARLSADSPRVRAIRAGIEVARADVAAAGRWPNPRATFNREAVSGVTENMVTLTQPLAITGRRGLQMSAASALVEASARRADDEVRGARAAMRMAYADLVAAQVREAELAALHGRLRELAQILARREAAGDAAGYDRLRAEREVVEVESEWSAARADRTRAQGELAAFFADPGDVTRLMAVVPQPAVRPAVPGPDELIARAQMVRGEPAALRQEIESARFADRAAARRLVPEPELVAGTKSSNAAGGDIGSVFSIHITVPLFDRAQPERTLAQAQLAQAEARAAALQAALGAHVATLRAIVIERREAADRYRASTMVSSGQLERIAQVSYDAGERGILELLDAYRSGAATRTRQVALDAGVRQAEIELELVSGWEIE